LDLGPFAEIGGEIETTYWRRAPVYWMSDDSEDVAYALRKLISVGRARHALPLAERGNSPISEAAKNCRFCSSIDPSRAA
jgi:hypothetical protein